VILRGKNGCAVELSIHGYQFPTGSFDWHDRNWLIVSVRLTGPAATITGEHDPCTTPEALELVSWLRGLVSGKEQLPEMSFLEPELTFTAVERTPQATRLRVTARNALVRGSPDVGRHGKEEAVLEIEVTSEELATGAQQLALEAARYPERPAND
jgi:hypothetical protein